MNSRLSTAGRAQIFSHEFYGHVYAFMIFNGWAPPARHFYINGEDYNTHLNGLIKNAIDQTIKFMNGN